jgi:hypothetical protein
VQDIQQSYNGDPWIVQLKEKLKSSDSASTHLTVHQNIILYKGHICIGATHNWRNLILKDVPDSSQGGHSG